MGKKNVPICLSAIHSSLLHPFIHHLSKCRGLSKRWTASGFCFEPLLSSGLYLGHPIMLSAIDKARCPELLMATLPVRKLQPQRGPETSLAYKWGAKTCMYAHLHAESLLHLSASLSVQKQTLSLSSVCFIRCPCGSHGPCI